MVSSHSWYFLQFHEEGHSPYLQKFAHDQWRWIHSNSFLRLTFGKQIDTININKSNYTCTDENSNRFMHCMENYYSKKLGCLLPWAMKNEINNGSINLINLCEGTERFKEFKNIAMNILKSDANKELKNEGCFIPNCLQRSWKIETEKVVERTQNNNIITGLDYYLPDHMAVLVREEVKLYTLINFFAEVGGYLGLLLGESLISYLIITSNWFQILGRKLKERCRKAEEEPESPPA